MNTAEASQTEIVLALITQAGTLLALVVSIILTAVVKNKVDKTDKKVDRAEAHAAQAATDAAVVRSETRNSHPESRPMRHDLDKVMEAQDKIIKKLDTHDGYFRSMQEDTVKQWAAVASAHHVALEASNAAAQSVRLVSGILNGK